MERIARLLVGNGTNTKLIVSDISFTEEDPPAKIINGWDEENEDTFIPSTLKDISIIMETMVGQGTTWQLANELSKRLKINNPALISDIWFEIFKEYSTLSDKEANEKWESCPELYDPCG
jgi:hypothetical protein